jgi:hypothetical protein
VVLAIGLEVLSRLGMQGEASSYEEGFPLMVCTLQASPKQNFVARGCEHCNERGVEQVL